MRARGVRSSWETLASSSRWPWDQALDPLGHLVEGEGHVASSSFAAQPDAGGEVARAQVAGRG